MLTAVDHCSEFAQVRFVPTAKALDDARLFVEKAYVNKECDKIVHDVLFELLDVVWGFIRAVDFESKKNAYEKFSFTLAKWKGCSDRWGDQMVSEYAEFVNFAYEEVCGRMPKLIVEDASECAYACDRDGKTIHLRVKIGLDDKCVPPITLTKITISPSETCLPCPDGVILKCGGSYETEPVEIVLSDGEFADGRGVVEVCVTYLGYTDSTPCNESFEVQYQIQYEEVEDPYCDWIDKEAEGTSFVGRHVILSRMRHVVDLSSGGMGFMICGQRRSGKSSLLKAFGRSLPLDSFVFTYVDVQGCFESADPIAVLVKCIGSELVDDGRLDENWESTPDFLGLSPEDELDRMAKIVTAPSRKWCIAIDEFTDVYDAYFLSAPSERKASLIRFLKVLRRLLSKKAFHLFAAVQNSVYRFEAEFADLLAPFGSIERLDGLSEDEVDELVRRLDGKMLRIRRPERVELMRLTAGYPLMLLHLMSAITKSMNRMSSSMITLRVIRYAVSQLSDCRHKVVPKGKYAIQPLRAYAFQSLFNLWLLKDEEDMNGLVLSFYYGVSVGDLGAVGLTDGGPESMVAQLTDRGIVVCKEMAQGKVKYGLSIAMFSEWLRHNPHVPVREFIGRT